MSMKHYALMMARMMKALVLLARVAIEDEAEIARRVCAEQTAGGEYAAGQTVCAVGVQGQR